MKPMRLTYRIFYRPPSGNENFIDVKAVSIELALRHFALLKPEAIIARVEKYYGPRRI